MTHFCQCSGASVVKTALGDDHVCLNPVIPRQLTNPTQLFEYNFHSSLVRMRSFGLGEKLRPVSGAPRDDTCNAHHAPASYPQQQPCTRLEAESQDRQVRSRARVSKTEPRGHLTACLTIVALSHAVARVGPGTVCGRGGPGRYSGRKV